MLTSVDMVNITAKINKTLNFFPFMLSLKLYEMISLCFSLLVCPSPGKVNVVKYKKNKGNCIILMGYCASVSTVFDQCGKCKC